MKKKILFITIGTLFLTLVIINIPAAAYSHELQNQIDSNFDTDQQDPIYETAINTDSDWYYKPNSYGELVSWYQELEDNYPDYIEVFKANELYGTGKATGGYDLYYVRITNESRGLHKPEVLFVI